MKYKRTFKIENIFNFSPENGSKLSESINFHNCPVQRIEANSVSGDSNFLLDVNVDIYPILNGEKIELVLLKLDQEKKMSFIDFQNSERLKEEKPLFDSFEYIIFGTIFHIGRDTNSFFFYASFGGLLMKFFSKKLEPFFENLKVDSEIFLLIKKI